MAERLDMSEESEIIVKRRTFDHYRFDQEYGYVHREHQIRDYLGNWIRRKCSWSKQSAKESLFGLVPILRWLPNYNLRRDMLGDIVAGITVGIMHIPQGMAYASLAGLSPVYGLYTSFFPTLIYLLFGTSKHISLGTVAVISLLVGSVRFRYDPSGAANFRVASENQSGLLSAMTFVQNGSDVVQVDGITAVTSLTFVTGAILIAMGILRLGFLSVYLSDQLINGYITGTAVMVFTSQLDKVFGIKGPRYDGMFKLYYTYRDIIGELPNTNIPTLIITLICIFIIFIVKECVSDRYKRQLKVPIPIDLIVIIVATLVSYYTDLHDTYGIKVVSHVPAGLPSPKLPDFSLMPELISDGFSLAVVLYCISISMAKIFAKKHNYKIDPTQELYVYGLVSIFGSFFYSWSAGASLSRSSVNESAGSKTQELIAIGFVSLLGSGLQCWSGCGALARSCVNESVGANSQLSGIFACAILLVVLLWLGPLFEALPMCVLAAIIIVALKGMFMQFRDLKTLWPMSKIDFLIWLFSFVATVICDVKIGLAVALGFAILTTVVRTQRPPTLLLAKIPDTDIYRDIKRYRAVKELPGVKIFRFDSPIYFANAELFRSQLYNYIKVDPQEIKKEIEQKHENESRMANGGTFALLTCMWRQKHVHKDVNIDATTTTMRKLSGVSHQASLKSLALEINPELPHTIIIDCSGFNYLDVMGVHILQSIYRELNDIAIQLFLANCKANVRKMFEDCNIYKDIPKEHLFLSIEDAVITAEKLHRLRLNPPDTHNTDVSHGELEPLNLSDN